MARGAFLIENPPTSKVGWGPPIGIALRMPGWVRPCRRFGFGEWSGRRNRRRREQCVGVCALSGRTGFPRVADDWTELAGAKRVQVGANRGRRIVAADHRGRRLNQLGTQARRRYHAHLFREKKLAVGTVGLHVAALRFFFVRVLKRRELKEELPTPKRHRRLPTVLSPDEVRQLIAGAKNLYHRTMLMTLYGAADTGVSSGSFDGTINPSH